MAGGLLVRGWGGIGVAEMGRPDGPRGWAPAGDWRSGNLAGLVGLEWHGAMAKAGP